MQQFLVDEETREEIHILKTGKDTQGSYVEFDNVIPSGTPSPPFHAHPRQTEFFEVLQGTLRIYTQGQEIDLVAGETTQVEPGTFHTFENPSTAPLKMRVQLSPALDAENLYDGLLGLHMQRSKVSALLRLARLLTSVESWFYLSGPKSLQRMGFHLLSVLARLVQVPYPHASTNSTEENRSPNGR